MARETIRRRGKPVRTDTQPAYQPSVTQISSESVSDISQISLFGSAPTWFWFLATTTALLLHLAAAPYTKVEESFNLQAAHDLIFHGPLAVDRFDHMEFPGPVRRTFVGAVAVWLASLPLTAPILIWPNSTLYSSVLPHTKIALQYVVRGILAVAVAASLAAVHASSRRAHGRIAASWFTILSIVQFHLIFWGSRTIPNTYALILFNVAFAAWIDSIHAPKPHRKRNKMTSSSKTTISLLAFAAVVCRAEMALPLAIIIVSDVFLARRYSLMNATIQTAIASILSLTLVVAIDAYFWRSLIIWPELESFFFNVVKNKSVEWGVLPFHAYFTSLLPRITPASYPIFIITTIMAGSDPSIAEYSRLVYVFVGIYSLLGHKEWRFVMYIVPVINLVAGIGISRLYKIASGTPTSKKTHQKSTDLSKFIATLFIWIVKCVAIALVAASITMLYISSLNYPGGVAFDRFHALISDSANINADRPASEPCHVHIDTYAAMTGVSRFGEQSQIFPVPCIYSKNESHKAPQDYVEAGYTHLITSDPQMHLSNSTNWKLIESVQGYSGLRLRILPTWITETLRSIAQTDFQSIRFPNVVIMEPKVHILARRT